MTRHRFANRRKVQRFERPLVRKYDGHCVNVALHSVPFQQPAA
jgi:hypothetical protein